MVLTIEFEWLELAQDESWDLWGQLMHQNRLRSDFLVIGCGVIGLSIGIALLNGNPRLKVRIVEKESHLGLHASGRNSGVLHAGFYYSPDSLKAKFCREGNQELRKLAKNYNVPIRNVGKVVVARNESENLRLDDLLERGATNGVDLELLNASELKDFEPLAKTHERFLWSPSTGISDPHSIIEAMKVEFQSLGGVIHYADEIALEVKDNEVFESTHRFLARHYINAAGGQADRISRKIGVGEEFAMVPFMGVYRATAQLNLPLQRLVYPVPHVVNPFLGVHLTLTLDNKVKIGPTAIPIAGREQYSTLTGWSISDISQTFKGVSSIVRHDAHDFGAILRSEFPKFQLKSLVREASELVPNVTNVDNWSKKPPGIRAQLVHLPTGKLVQDFVVSSHLNSTHVLNAVSPGWTSALPFGKYVVENLTL
jgi:L-2-hydroxyglutarate oxidase